MIHAKNVTCKLQCSKFQYQVYEERMYGPLYQWIILGTYSPRWWEILDPDTNGSVPRCSPQQLNESLRGHFATDILPLSTDNVRTDCGLVGRIFKTNAVTSFLY